MTNRQRQGGLSILGFIFVAAVVVIFAMIGFRTLPSYVEYFTVKKVLAKTLEDAKEGFSMYDFRRYRGTLCLGLNAYPKGLEVRTSIFALTRAVAD